MENMEQIELNKTAHKLVTIRSVDKIEPIIEADLIEKVKIGGWNVIAKKGEFKVGDLGVLFEVDAFLPFHHEKLHEHIAFLEKDVREYLGIQGIRIKTKKMRGVISQGLFLPLSKFPELKDKQIGDEVSDFFGVIKYNNASASASTSSQYATLFPSFITKTDCERIQNFTIDDALNTNLMTQPTEITVKYDGTSLTNYVCDNKDLLASMNFFDCKFIDEEERGKIPEIHVGICSRNQEVYHKDDGSVYVVESQINKLDKILRQYHAKANELNLPQNIAIQGEIIGMKINGNFEKINGKNEIHLFNIFDIDKQSYTDYNTKQAIFNALQNIANELNTSIQHVKLAENVPQNQSIMELIGLTKQEYEDITKNIRQIKEKINDNVGNDDVLKTLFTQYQEEKTKIYEQIIEKVQNFFLDKADGNGYKQNKREGIVIKTHDGKHIFKAISNAYLLKFEK